MPRGLGGRADRRAGNGWLEIIARGVAARGVAARGVAARGVAARGVTARGVRMELAVVVGRALGAGCKALRGGALSATCEQGTRDTELRGDRLSPRQAKRRA